MPDHRPGIQYVEIVSDPARSLDLYQSLLDYRPHVTAGEGLLTDGDGNPPRPVVAR